MSAICGLPSVEYLLYTNIQMSFGQSEVCFPCTNYSDFWARLYLYAQHLCTFLSLCTKNWNYCAQNYQDLTKISYSCLFRYKVSLPSLWILRIPISTNLFRYLLAVFLEAIFCSTRVLFLQ